MPEYQLVDLTADGSPLHAVATEPRIGIDTEFMRERTYFAKLCLVQVSTPTEVYCADPVGTGGTGRPNKRFWDSILQPEWVLHSGRQDLEVIYQAAGKLPEAVFDTQIAAALLGYQPQIGYGSLVNELFDVELAKSHTRADWSKRPISAALLEYAAEDVKFLLPAYDTLVEKLDAAGRLEWAVQDSSDLLNAKLYKVDPDD
ncbi:MAG: ribonuclease D, partial [Pseudomonadota bacterium]|nr:ribonuclease D [Pseudomonadota bacterium]